VVFHTALVRRFSGLCLARSLPAAVFPLRSLACDGQGLLAGSSRRETRLRSSLRSSNHNPLGNCVGAQVETSCGPNSARARFLIAARRTAPVRVWTGTVTKPSRGTGDICLSRSRQSACGGAARTSCGQPFPGCPGLSQSCSRRVFQAAALRLNWLMKG
jgi:hypothetical protein